MTIFRFFAALFWSSWFMWASYSFLLELFGGAEGAFPEQAICASRKEKRVSSPWGQPSGLGCCDRIPCLWEMENNPPGWALVMVGPSFQDPHPLHLCSLLSGMSWWERVVSGLEGKRYVVPLAAHCLQASSPYSQASTVGLAQCCQRNETTQSAFCCLGQGFGSPSSVKPRVIRCPVTVLFLKSVFFLFSEFYGYLFKFQSVVSFSRDRYEKNECMPLSGPRRFLNPLLFIFFFRLPNLS